MKKPFESQIDEKIYAQNEIQNHYDKINDKRGIKSNKLKALVKPPPLPRNDALGSRIEAINKVSNTLMIKNDRIGRNARQVAERTRRPFNKLDEDMLKEYVEKKPATFEYIDENGEVKYRKYLVPNALPELEEDANFIPESELKNAENSVNERLNDLLKTINEEQLKINRLQKLLEQTKEQINMGYATEEDGQEQIDNILYTIESKKVKLNLAEQEFNSINEFKSQLRPHFETYNAKVSEIKKRNLQKVNMYRDELNFLNRGAFSTEKADTESEMEYLQRLQQNAEILAPEDELYDAKQSTISTFREKMRELIKDPVIIEQVINSLDADDENVDNKAILLKEWNIVKRKFINSYGINNTKINASDIITFFNYFLTKGETGMSLAMEQELKQPEPVSTIKNMELIPYPEYDMVQIVHHTAGGDKNLFLKSVTDNTNKFLLFSFTGDEGSFIQFFDKDVPSDRKIKGQKSRSQFVIEEKTGILPQLLNAVFGLNFLQINVRGIIKAMNDMNIRSVPITSEDVKKKRYSIFSGGEKTQIEYGMGIKAEDIPNLVPFGNVYILMKKLYYNNQLAVRNKYKKTIAGFKTEKVSEPFVKLIMNMSKGLNPTHSDISHLSNKERMLYDKLIMLGNLNKSIPHQGDKTVEELKKRLKLIEAQIEIGNNNPMLKQEIYTILHSLKNFKVITQGQINKYMKQF